MTVEMHAPIIHSDEAVAAARDWLTQFERGLASSDSDLLDALLTEDVYWRDFLVFEWDFASTIGRPAVKTLLLDASNQVSGLALYPGYAPAFDDLGGGTRHLIIFFEFVGTNGPAFGVARLSESADGEGWKCLGLMARLEEVAGYPANSRQNRPIARAHKYVPNRARWLDIRDADREFADSEPQVVVIGAGQCGLASAARLHEYGVSCLLLEKTERVGDVWRNRYASLALHDPIHMDHMPFVGFPDTWPHYAPKDKFADFLEGYAKTLDLNVWNSTTVQSVKRDGDEHWKIEVVRGDGSSRTLRPRHVILATGLNGRPNIPQVPGAKQFGGTVIHSDGYRNGEEWTGKRAVVVGAGVSAHEVGLDLHEQGAAVTIVQRSSTYVVNASTFHRYLLSMYLEGGRPVELADMVANATPNNVAIGAQQYLTDLSIADDKELLDALEEAGFALQSGPDGRGVYGLALSGRDGYHINVGAAELVADGSIAIKSGVEVVGLEPGKVMYSDGTFTEADLVVWATGYDSILETLRDFLGPIADSFGQVYGLADDGEWAETWRRSGVDGMWFAPGFIAVARFYSRLLALQIKAIEEGVQPYHA